MVKKLKQLAEQAPAGNPLAEQVRESAQQIWLAGLGAFGKAQSEGQKVFQALVQEGASLQKRTRAAVGGDKVAEMSKMAGKMAGQAGGKANAAWDKLEQVFEDRVARALGSLGVPTRADMENLAKRVDALNASVKALGTRPARQSRKARKPSSAATPAVE
jgi:poly(hydroxyalkanoate) granule-associated protein